MGFIDIYNGGTKTIEIYNLSMPDADVRTKDIHVFWGFTFPLGSS
jgi:hypothetical protein